MERLLPRNLQLIYDINAAVLTDLRALPDNHDQHLAEVSIIDEGYGRFVRMGHLAFMGARRVNGVSALHGELMKQTVFRPLHHFFPDRITAITNGVTPRRWLLDCNPDLAALITEGLGDQRWLADLEQLERLAPLAEDALVPAALRRDQADEQGKGRGLHCPPPRHRAVRPMPSLTCRSSASTSTSASS